MNYITGGVSAAQGFTAAGIHCGIKESPQPDGNQDPSAPAQKKDLLMILSDTPCSAAAVFTKNIVQAAPIAVSKENIRQGKLRGIIANSGNANACAPNGYEHAQRMVKAAAAASGLSPSDFGVASTGVIGVELNIGAVEAAVPALVEALSDTGSSDAATAMLTTDLSTKEIAVRVQLDGVPVSIGAIAKGSGMIHPNMGTMLCFCTTDCAIDTELLQKTLEKVVSKTFNRISVDGDTSTNDSCFLLANGKAGNPPLQEGTPAYEAFYGALLHVMEYEARKIAADGEGASRLITCTVREAEDEEQAEQIAKAVISSALVKTAVFGADANWGRILCAAGYSGASFDPQKISVRFRSQGGELLVCEKGAGLSFSEHLAKKVLSQGEVTILVDLAAGEEEVSCWGCDLTYDYVKINGDYRS